MAFSGFGKDFFNFFKELEAHNNRDWFQENKPRYEQDVVIPCLDFIESMGGPLKEISPHFTAIPKKQGGSMFRIYKDIRFSKDKTPYKTHAGLQFRHALGKDAHAPGFYLHLAPDEIFYGGGMWRPPSEALHKIRALIDEQPKLWTKMIGDAAFQETYGDLEEGDPLVRAPKGYAPDHMMIDALKKRSFFALKKSTKKAAGAKDFPTVVAAAFDDVAPLMSFLCRACGVRY